MAGSRLDREHLRAGDGLNAVILDRAVAIDGLSRREVVALLSGIAMTLAGCGSGAATGTVTPPPPPASPPPPPPTGSSQVSGTVSLPSGSTLAPSTLTVRTLGQTVALASSATFTAGISPNAPTLAVLTDANGNGVMAALLDPTLSGSQAINARSTGVTLLWFLLGGPFLPANVKSQLLGLLGADPAIDALAATITTRIAASPLAIVNGDSQIAAALSTAVGALTSGSSLHTAHLAQPSGPIVSVNPSTDQSGVSVGSDNSITGIDVANSFRRPVRAYVYETQHEASGVVTDVTPAKLVAGPFDLGEPTAVTLTGGIRTLFNIPAPFHSFTLAPIPLTLDGASDSTTYEVVVIGPSASGVVPAFFGAARYAGEVAGWTSAIADMFSRTYYTDLVYALLLEITGFGSVFPASPNLVAAGVNTRKFAGIPFSGNSLPLPPSPQSLGTMIDSAVLALNSDPTLVPQYQEQAVSLLDSIEAQALQKVNSIDWEASIKSGSNFLLKLSSPFSNYQANGALSKLLSNLANSDPGDLWTVTLDKAQVTITPPSPFVNPGDIQALTVVLSSDLTSTYEYDWASSSSTATFSAVGESNVGAAINTQKMAVDLLTTINDTVPIVITLTVYDLAGGRRAFLTRVSTTVSLLQPSAITPASVVLSVGAHQTFSVAVTGTLPSGVQYLWSDVGGSGSIGPANVVTTSAPQISYTAVQKGTDTLTVQVIDASNKLLARATAAINVDPDAFVQFTITGLVASGPPAGGYAFGDGVGVRLPSVSAGVDAIFFEYDNTGSAAGATVQIFLPAGHSVSSGEVFTNRVGAPPLTAGTFRFALSQDLNNVDHSGQVNAPGSGSLTINSLNQQSDGTFVAQYSFSIVNGTVGTVVGSGVGSWK